MAIQKHIQIDQTTPIQYVFQRVMRGFQVGIQFTKRFGRRWRKANFESEKGAGGKFVEEDFLVVLIVF